MNTEATANKRQQSHPCSRINCLSRPEYHRCSKYTATFIFGLLGLLFADLAYPGEPQGTQSERFSRKDTESLETYARRLNLPLSRTIQLGNEVSPFELVLISAGTFTMGTQEPEPPREMVYIGQAILACAVIALAMLIIPVVLRSIKQRHWPQISLKRLLVLMVAISFASMGAMRWRGVLLKQQQYYQAVVKYSAIEDNEKPAHAVTVVHPFYMARYETRQSQWKAIMGTNPSIFKGDHLPVENVSWHDVQLFLRRLSRAARIKCRLPTEEESEYACRAGSTTDFSFGNEQSTPDDYAWFRKNSEGHTHQVGMKRPNAWGLYDMHGNVYE